MPPLGESAQETFPDHERQGAERLCYEIGAVAGEGWAVLVVTEGTRSRVIGPWATRHPGTQLALLEAVERATMLDLDQLNTTCTIYVTLASVVAVCRGTRPDDGFAGLRKRLAEGLFLVLQCDPPDPPPCHYWATDLLREHVGACEGRSP